MPLPCPPLPIVNKAHTLANGLVMDMPFWQGAGTIIAENQGENIGFYQGTGAMNWQKGLYGNAISMPASTGNLEVFCGVNVVFPTRMTWAALVKVNNANSTNRKIAESQNAGAADIYFGFETGATNQLGFGFQDTNGVFQETLWTSGFAANSTHLCIGIYDGGSLALYADSDPKAKASGVQTANAKGQTMGTPFFDIGNTPSSRVNVWDGNMYFFRAWNRALTTQERLLLWTDPWGLYRKKSFGALGF